MAAVLAVVLLAGLACLFVFDIISRETLQDLTVKTILGAVVLGAAAVAIGFLASRRGDS